LPSKVGLFQPAQKDYRNTLPLSSEASSIPYYSQPKCAYYQIDEEKPPEYQLAGQPRRLRLAALKGMVTS
jgi:hypothetical protein